MASSSSIYGLRAELRGHEEDVRDVDDAAV